MRTRARRAVPVGEGQVEAVAHSVGRSGVLSGRPAVPGACGGALMGSGAFRRAAAASSAVLRQSRPEGEPQTVREDRAERGSKNERERELEGEREREICIHAQSSPL